MHITKSTGIQHIYCVP